LIRLWEDFQVAREPKKPHEDTASEEKPSVTARSYPGDTKLSEFSVNDLTAIMRQEIAAALAALRIPGGPPQGVHVNSGPPGFVNGGGHANFDPESLAGTHVNSGPPGFVNGGGHANFDPSAQGGVHVNSGPPGFVNGGGHANFDPGSLVGGGPAGGVHVNSGPPGFVNGGGHANFDPGSLAGGGLAGGAHANSGPPGFVNGGGHANFDPGSLAGIGSQINVTRVTLPGGLRVDVPQGRFDMTVRGVRIKR
jgi:hypothetical protein